MEKRITVFFSFLISCVFFIIVNLNYISGEKSAWLKKAAAKQYSYKLKVAKLRGNIYDCNKINLINNKNNNIAAVLPDINLGEKLRKIFSQEEVNEILEKNLKNEPFTLKLPENIDLGTLEDIKFFEIPERYNEKQICPHVIGYLNSEGNGVCGVEKSFNDFFKEKEGVIYVKYTMDALGKILPGAEEEIEDESCFKKRGVVLTIDKNIQEIAENAMKKHIQKGAAVVLEVPSGEIRALVSMPDFSPKDLEQALNSKDSPLINRAFCAYNLGSIFKIVTSAAALESGVDKDEIFKCTGSFNDFSCYNKNKHGEVNMKEALKLSCNGYFINLSEKIGAKQLLEKSYNFGFGKELKFASELISSAGKLPELKDLSAKKALGNFSFGQGDLMATPVQVAGLLNSVVSNGNYIKPSLIKGLVDENLEYIKINDKFKGKKVMSKNNAEFLKDSLRATVEEGTGRRGKPDRCTSGAKTSTAETGIKLNDKFISQGWFGGFFPYENPRYVIVVLAENAETGGGTCGPVFKEIADNVFDNFLT